MVNATVEFAGGKQIHKTFATRDHAEGWLVSLNGSYIGWLEDGTFSILCGWEICEWLRMNGGV